MHTNEQARKFGNTSTEIKRIQHSDTEAVQSSNSMAGTLLSEHIDAYSRQNSMNETQEYNCDISMHSDKTYVHFPASLQNYSQNSDNKVALGDNKITTYSRQTSESPLVLKPISNSTVVEMPKTMADAMDYTSKESGWSDLSDTDSRNRNGCGSCSCVMSLFACFVSVITLGLMMFLYYKEVNDQGYLVPDVFIGHSKQVSTAASDEGLSGNFKLNQAFLFDHKEIRWTADDTSIITPSENEPCLVIPVSGKYLVLSRFTFRIPPGVDKTVLTHRLILKSETEREVFKRQYISVLEHKLNENEELRKPSQFIQFFEIQSGDKLCAEVSNPELLYISSIDNDLNIIKQ